MKTISLICCILLAFLLFSSPSIMARELAADHDHEADGTTADKDKINNPNLPGKSCGSPKDPQYAACIGKQKPKSCSKGNSYHRCNPPAQG